MRKEIMETGKTVDAAIDSACEKLGCERESCEWEIIDLPKKGFLGLKSFPAKVRVAIEIPDPKPVQKELKIPPNRQEPKEIPPRKEVRENKEDKKREQKPITPKAAAQPTPHVTPPPPVAESEEDVPVRVVVTDGFTEKEQAAISYIEAIVHDFGLNASFELSREGNGICVNISGDGLGAIIGRRGETLDAIQYLAGLVANRLDGDYLRITVDCGGYRDKRKETLEALARKLSSQVLKTNTSKTLEPMNPFERRVIHATVSKIEGVSSSSIGDEPNRRVVITTPTARRGSSRGGYNNRDSNRGGDRRPRGGGGGGRRNNAPNSNRGRSSSGGRPSSSAPVDQGPPKQTPEASVGGGLYEKMDLE